jgi:hypothetical protein
VAILLIPEMAIDLAPRQQLLMFADIFNAASFKDQNCVGCYQRREPMRDND